MPPEPLASNSDGAVTEWRTIVIRSDLDQPVLAYHGVEEAVARLEARTCEKIHRRQDVDGWQIVVQSRTCSEWT